MRSVRQELSPEKNVRKETYSLKNHHFRLWIKLFCVHDTTLIKPFYTNFLDYEEVITLAMILDFFQNIPNILYFSHWMSSSRAKHVLNFFAAPKLSTVLSKRLINQNEFPPTSYQEALSFFLGFLKLMFSYLDIMY